jgi:hypothetical protein
MPIGECRLCLRKRHLQNSHYIPSAMYKALRDGRRKNPNPVFMTKARTSTTSKQITDYIFCAECEQRFGKRESYVMSILGRGNRFPLRDRMNLIVPLVRHSESIEYSGQVLGIDTEALGYFALSMIWRGAVNAWRDPYGGTSQVLHLAGMQEPIRAFLFNETPFPADAALTVRVCTDRTARETVLAPSRVDETNRAFEMFIPGVSLFVFLASAITPVIRAMCCVHSPKQPLFLRNCEPRLGQHFADIEKSSKRTDAIMAEWP